MSATRQRKANEETVTKTIAFLRALKVHVDNTGELNLNILRANHSVSANTGRACKDVGIITESVIPGKWIFNGTPDRLLALKVMDNILQSNKKWVNPALIPDQANISKTLAEISEKLSVSIDQNNIALKRMRSGSNPTREESLFTKEEQRRRDRVYIAGQIAGPLLMGINHADPPMVDQYTSIIVNTTDILLKKLEE